jgi:SAM-dependent methyltransferase
MIDWNERYGDETFAYGTEPNDFLVDVSERIPRGDVLCLCEGEGRNAVYLAGLGCRVTGVDASEVGLDKAQRLATERGVSIKTICSDLGGFHIQPQSWDAIVSIFCHVPPALRHRVHRECVAGLRPGGLLVLEAYTPRQLEHGTGGPPVAELTMQLADLRRELEGLDIELAEEKDRDVIEGQYHHGRGAVVQIVGIKRE